MKKIIKSSAVILATLVVGIFYVPSVGAQTIANGDLIRAHNDIKVHIVNDNGFRRHIPSPETFNSYGFDWQAIRDIPKEEVEKNPETNLIRVAGSNEVYRTVGGERQWIKNPQVFEESGLDWGAIMVVTPADAEYFNKGKDIDKAIPATPAEPATPTKPQDEEPTPTEPATPAEPAQPQKPGSDTTSPTISNVQAINITATSATITWVTDEPASGEVYYASSSPIFATSTTANIFATSTVKVTGADSVTSHSIDLLNLTDSTTYYYAVVSKDAAGNTATSSEKSFTTLLPTSNWSNKSLGVSGEYQSMTWNGDGYGAVYGRRSNGNGKLYFAKLDANGTLLSEVVLATPPDFVLSTNIIWDGSKYGVVWVEANPHNLRFATVDIDGNVLSNIPVTAGTDNTSGDRPALAWTGSEYILVWSSGWPDSANNCCQKIIYFSKIASDGQTVIIDKKKSVTSGDARAANGPIVSLAQNGANFGVAWQDIRDSGDSNNPALYFNVLDNNGDKLIDNDVKVSGDGRVGSPQIFADGANFIVFWSESTVDDVNAKSIYVAKLDSAGSKVLTNQNLNTKGDREIRPSVVKTDNGYGIVWTSYPEQRIYFKSIDSSASITLDNELVSTPSGSNDRAYLTWSDSKYGVIWTNVQNNQLQLYFGTK